MGYIIFIVVTMLLLPIASASVQGGPLSDVSLLGKWFIFWGIGVRLLVAALVQIFRPNITASILNVSDSSYVLIRELGFANLIFGILAVLSLFNLSLRLAATAGGFYMGLAGIYHVMRHHSATTVKESVALVSDLWILLVVVVYVATELRK